MIIIAYKPGQLANRIFHFAKFLAYSYEHHVAVVNPAFDDYARYFCKTKAQWVPASNGFSGNASRNFIALIYHGSYIMGRLLHKLQVDSKFMSVTYLDWHEKYDLDEDKKLRTAGFHFVQGWGFNAARLVDRHKNKIIEFFRPENNLEHKIDDYFQRFNIGKRWVGVHIRHGDYQFFEGGKYFYDLTQYKTAMRSLAEKHSDLHFLICTNNKSISQSNFDELTVTLAPGHELMDLYLLAKCNYIMGPPSTYSLWASFYGNVPLYQIKNVERGIDFTDFKLSQ
jgi:hypothetical protein